MRTRQVQRLPEVAASHFEPFGALPRPTFVGAALTPRSHDMRPYWPPSIKPTPREGDILKKLVKLSLMAAALSIGAGQAHAVRTVTVPEVSFAANGFGIIEVISTDGQSWSQIKKTDLFFPVSVSASISSGYLRGYRVKLGNQTLAHELYAPDKPTSFQKSMILKGVTTEYSGVYQDKIIAQCNEMLSSGNGINETHTLTYDAKLWLTVWSGFGDQGGSYEPVVTGKSLPISLKCLKKHKYGSHTANNNIKFDQGPFKVTDIDLFLTTFSGANTQPNPASICKKAEVKVRLKTTKAGATKFKLWTKVGGVMSSKVIDAWASHDGNGGFKAEHTEWFSVNKPTYVQAKAEEMVSGFGSSTSWEDIMLQCTNPGGDGLATQNPDPTNSDDLPQAKNVEGDFAFVDHGSPKCERQGKALLTFRSPKQDNIHYSLDCKDDNHSGVVPTVPHPDGGYAAAALVAFDVKKTYTEACTLRTVAPYGPEDHVSKHHLFQCVTSSGHSASNDVQVPSNPPSGNTSAPHGLVVPTGTSGYPFPPWQCVDGYPR
ncbi:MAG: hypothetical protein OEM91_13260, partial [Hyphomicrobiales bacterium]|nr:hypothetical protein [Hyphomicrobiales bacterium]